GQSGVLAADRIDRIALSYVVLPLKQPVSDAKVLTGRQKPLSEVGFVFAEIGTRDGVEGVGFGYSKRAGGLGIYAHAKEIASNLLGEDPSDIQKIYTKLLWAGASVGRSGMTAQALSPFDIALWDIKAKRARLPLAKLIGSHRASVQCYNTSGGFLQAPLDEVLRNIDVARERGIGGIKIKVGQPDVATDMKRVEAVRRHLGDSFPLMVDANQQWDRVTAMRVCRRLEPFNLVWIEEPLDAYDNEGHAQLAAALDTPIATGEMLTSYNEHAQLIHAGGCDFVQPDAPRVGGVTPFLQILALADSKGLQLAPHFAMEIHVHLSATYAREPWLEHFEWLEPLFNERLELREGRMMVPDRAGVGFTLSGEARRWTKDKASFTA
ncbi:MAG: mandelate racemase/muconate lactonizing enzyme family protein, partial [Burkholderiales bacterium]|nr:mandelate racemase/muconate lactonizing enzyme family protein [Burkholderiales bacterium]